MKSKTYSYNRPKGLKDVRVLVGPPSLGNEQLHKLSKQKTPS